jgi:hypothetical protein
MTNANKHQVTGFKQTGSAAVVQMWFPSQASIHDNDDDTTMAGKQTFTYKLKGV